MEENKTINIERNNIYNIDCFEGFKYMSDNSVTHTITSPPYNLSNSIRSGSKTVKVYQEYEDNLSHDEYYKFIYNTIKECIRVSQYYVFFNFQILKDNKQVYFKILNDFSENIKDIIIWNKTNSPPSISPTCLSSSFEFIIVFADKDKSTNRSFEKANFNNRIKGNGVNSNVITTTNSANEKFENRHLHKAVFPEHLINNLINKFVSKEDIVFDPFIGTGTTAVCCKKHNIDYIGFELSKQYCEIAEKRLSEVKK